MARKKKIEQKEEVVEEKIMLARDAFQNYLELSKFLFADPDNSIYDVNELEPDEKFYPLAKDISGELKIDWKTMSHEDSNRIMLLMLERAYQKVRDSINAKSVIIEYQLKEVTDNNGSTNN